MYSTLQPLDAVSKPQSRPTSRPPLIRKANIAAAKDHGSERGIAEPPIVKNSRGVKARVNMMCMSRMRSGPEARPGLGWL